MSRTSKHGQEIQRKEMSSPRNMARQPFRNRKIFDKIIAIISPKSINTDIKVAAQ